MTEDEKKIQGLWNDYMAKVTDLFRKSPWSAIGYANGDASDEESIVGILIVRGKERLKLLQEFAENSLPPSGTSVEFKRDI